MEELKDIIRRQHAERTGKDDPLVDRLFAELLSMAEKVCVLQDRLDTCQQLANNGLCADSAAIDAYERDAADIERRLAVHKKYFEDLFGRISQSP